MDDLTGAVVFFDIGDTLASVTLSPDGRVAGLAAYPYVPEVLTALRDRGARSGIICDRGPVPAEEVGRALEQAGLRSFFAPELILYGRKDSSAIFEQAAARAGASTRHVFVGEDPGERAQAVRVGFQAVPHPLLVVPALEEQATLRYLRIMVPPGHATDNWRHALRALPLLPLHVTGEGGTTVYAIATTRAAARLDDLGFRVDRLGGEQDPLTTDVYLLRDDRQLRSGFLSPEGNSADFFGRGAAPAGVLASTDEGLVVTVAAGASVEDYHFRGAQHGHNLKLAPSPGLLETAPAEGLAIGSVAAGAGAGVLVVDAVAKEILDARVRPEHLAAHVERYSGARPVGTGDAVITSRHIRHLDNAAAVTALVADLQQVGGGCLAVRRHRFSHEGRRLDNVEAELAGTGLGGVVLVTAHLDSTAARQPGYRPAVDPAPGADDDASGTAAVLVAADAITALDAALGMPRRAVRFVLFNAEEHGLVGSLAYARDQATLHTPIVAVLQLDMIGHDVRPGAEWELHAGFTASPVAEGKSIALARVVAELVPHVSPNLPAPQVYPVAGEPDPAERRSDHYSFQTQGYAACLASEDFFAGPGPEAPPQDMNPNYHLPTDKTINPGYAADIARAVTAAAWITATR